MNSFLSSSGVESLWPHTYLFAADNTFRLRGQEHAMEPRLNGRITLILILGRDVMRILDGWN